MTSITRILLGTAVVYLTTFVPAASAQMEGSIKVHLPVSAHFGATEVPMGDYTIQQVKNSNGSPTLEVTSQHGGLHFFARAMRFDGMDRAETTTLTLTEQDGGYYVSKLAIAGSAQYYELFAVENK